MGLDRVGLLCRHADCSVRVGVVSRRRPWRRALMAVLKWVVITLCALLCVVTGALAVYGAVHLHLYYMKAPVPEPVPWSCPAEWVVMPGDTLWHIAKTCWPEAHTGQMVHEIRRLNPGIDPGRLRVGQVLRLPVAAEIVGGVE